MISLTDSMSARDRALEKKAVQQADKDAKEKAKADKAEEEAWNVGAKDVSKQKALEAKEAEKLRKKQELDRLAAEDEAAVTKKPPIAKKKKVIKLASTLRIIII